MFLFILSLIVWLEREFWRKDIDLGKVKDDGWIEVLVVYVSFKVLFRLFI